MLLQFVVENYKSFAGEAILSCVRSPQEKHDPVRLIALYGANAAGKSNLLQALQEARALIVHGAFFAEKPFQDATSAQARPVRFGFDILIEGTHYAYSFSLLDGAVFDELMVVIGEDDVEEVLFARGSPDSNADDGPGIDDSSRLASYFYRRRKPQKVQWGGHLSSDEASSFVEFLWDGTAPDQLILHKMFDYTRNLEHFGVKVEALLGWLQDDIWIDPRISHQGFFTEHHISAHEYYSLIAHLLLRPGFKEFLEELLQDTDTGIKSVECTESYSAQKIGRPPFSSTQKNSFDLWIPKEIEIQTDIFKGTNTNSKRDVVKKIMRFEYDIVFKHGGSNRYFSWLDESQGTRRLAWLAMVLFELVHGGNTLILIDEIERSLHPLLSKYLIEKSAKQKTTCQLIFTTHDTDLMNIKYLQPESICFVEKDKNGSSNLYSLADFKPEQVEHIREQLEMGYFIGRFGAIPALQHHAPRAESERLP